MKKSVPSNKPVVFGMDQEELTDLVIAEGMPKFRGKQLFQWLYSKGARSFDEMTNLPKAFRAILNEKYAFPTLKLALEQQATDKTIKHLYELPSGRKIETVLIPDFDEEGVPKRMTVCVSSQVGCAMGCTFCATGLMGFKENLSAGVIFEQVWIMNELAIKQFGKKVTNVVYMGMGEPLLNYKNVLRSIEFLTSADGMGLSSKRITVSTVGLAGRIRRLADDNVKFNLAVSLHAPTDGKRSAIMPVNRSEQTDLKALREALQYFYQKTRRQITYEYCLFDGYNDGETDARSLGRISGWVKSKVNLIVYNTVENTQTPNSDQPFRSPNEDRINAFVRELVKKKVIVTVRRSRGQDIDAACGQLATKAEAV